MTPANFNILLNKWRSGEITPEEARAFVAAARSGRYDDFIQEAMETDLDTERFRTGAMQADKISHWQWIESNMYTGRSSKKTTRFSVVRTTWFRAAAAVVILMTAVAVYYQTGQIDARHNSDGAKVPSQHDILPGGNKAVLVLANGNEMVLDDASPGQLAEQPGAIVKKTAEGQIIYSFNKSSVSNTTSYNTMRTPRGGQHQLTLPDGSRVWLNAESSISFPTAFTGKTREIRMKGEAYFEVKGDKSQPFIVETDFHRIEVLGTRFNVNAYSDELPKTALVEGRLKVNGNLLKPGQAYAAGKVVNTNTGQDIAWKNGVFAFVDADIQHIMRQIARWYDVDIIYDRGIPQGEFSGEIGRNLTLAEVLKQLSFYGFKYKIEGRTILITG